MAKRTIKYTLQTTCQYCGGLHYGSTNCPYLIGDPGGHIAAHQEEISNKAKTKG